MDSHGERQVENHRSISPIEGDLHASHGALGNHLSQYEMMVMDAAGPSFRDNYNEGVEEMTNTNAREFYDMLRAAQQPLWEGCEESQLSTMLQLLSIKASTNMSPHAFNLVSQLMVRTQPKDTLMLPDLYQTKKFVSKPDVITMWLFRLLVFMYYLLLFTFPSFFAYRWKSLALGRIVVME
ncbi:hypothetical protein K1719_046032 [Acacia pycnantha]|nr:hypothetical protein K1719_046032 [Acacia pycnantha]